MYAIAHVHAVAFQGYTFILTPINHIFLKLSTKYHILPLHPLSREKLTSKNRILGWTT